MINVQCALSLLVIVALMMSTGCSKPSELGLALVENEASEIFLTDTLSVELATVEPPVSSSSSTSRLLIGSYEDPIFGLTGSTTYMNFRITSTNATFPNAQLDSVVLSLAYDSTGHYGGLANNTNEVETWDVLELDETMDPLATYYSNTEFITKATPLAENVSFVPNIVDSVDVNGSLRGPHLRIRLADDLGNRLLNPTDEEVYATNENFKSYFQGIKIMPSGGATQNSIVRFIDGHVDTKLTLYYKIKELDDNGDSVWVDYSFSYLTDEDAESSLNYTHDYTNTTVLNNNPTDTAVYIQGLNGVAASATFPNLGTLQNIVVNKAELVLYVASEDTLTYSLPDRLWAMEQENDGAWTFVDDVLTSFAGTGGYTIFGGALDQSVAPFEYRMNLSEFFQRIIDGEIENNTLYLQNATAIDAQRVLLGNQNSQSFKAKLFLTYTLLN